jgi:stage II sporulation protein P
MINSKSNVVILYTKNILLWFISIILVFILIGIMTLDIFRISSVWLNSWIKDTETTELFKYALRSENHLFPVSNKNNSIFKLVFQVGTNIKINDPRSLLGRELPGFSKFDSNIQIAGVGTDYTTLPQESAPPIEELLKEREIASELLKNDEDKSNQEKQNIPDKKEVFIYHSHSWESYLPLLKNVKSPNEATSTNPNVNVIAVGEKLANELSFRGIGIEHNTSNISQQLAARGWNYNHSYQYSRELVKEAFASNNDITYLIDIHRDSLRREKTTITINGKGFARLFFIVGQNNKNFDKNLALAESLHNALEEKYPGLSRGVISKDKTKGNGVYNQDLSEGALLLEVGGVDNNFVELNNSIEAFAEIFSNYLWDRKNVENH